MPSDPNIKGRCWIYWIGIALCAAQPFLMMNYAHPLALRTVSIACYGFLVGDLFLCAVSDSSFIAFLIRTLFTCFLIVVTGAVLFQVAFALVRDTSCDDYVGYTVVSALGLSFSSLAYGGLLRWRSYRRNRKLLSLDAG